MTNNLPAPREPTVIGIGIDSLDFRRRADTVTISLGASLTSSFGLNPVVSAGIHCIGADISQAREIRQSRKPRRLLCVPLDIEVEWPGLPEKTDEYPSGLHCQDPYQSGP